MGAKRNFAVLGRKSYTGRPGQKVEICDLLTLDKKLVCVKRLDGADRLSHLFQQGSVSAKLMRDETYQKRILDALDAIGGGKEFGVRTDWTIVYAIATSKPGKLSDILTFFGKVALMTHAEMIADLGYRVAVAKIERP